jgi:hypothetical protein
VHLEKRVALTSPRALLEITTLVGSPRKIAE